MVKCVHSSSLASEWVAIDLHGIQKVDSIILVPRATLGFPLNFKIQSSNNGTVWSDIPGHTYANYSNTGTPQIFRLEHPLEASFIRIIADKLGKDDMGGLYFQLVEVQVIVN